MCHQVSISSTYVNFTNKSTPNFIKTHNQKFCTTFLLYTVCIIKIEPSLGRSQLVTICKLVYLSLRGKASIKTVCEKDAKPNWRDVTLQDWNKQENKQQLLHKNASINIYTSSLQYMPCRALVNLLPQKLLIKWWWNWLQLPGMS